jgi:hypothetical protein
MFTVYRTLQQILPPNRWLNFTNCSKEKKWSDKRGKKKKIECSSRVLTNYLNKFFLRAKI